MRPLLTLFLACLLLRTASAQIVPVSEFILGDTTSRLIINDFFAAPNGTIYSTGQYVKDTFGLYISAVTSAGVKQFELFRRFTFEERGLFIRPYDPSHFIVCGFSEDTTGTFNVRLLKVAYTGSVVWDTTFGNNGMSTMELPNDIAVDSQGNIIVGGISFSFDVRYLLFKISPSGALLWSVQSLPFAPGNFTVRDIIIGPSDDIYGVINNSFVDDTSHGTIMKWDPSGNVVWSRNFDLSFYEERGSKLALTGDTLIVAGTPWVNGQNAVSCAVVMLRTNGELLSYRKFPLYASQQGVRDIRALSDGSIVLIDETFFPPEHRLHTIVLSPSLALIYRDSLAGMAPLSGSVTSVSGSSFETVRYGPHLSTVRYQYTGAGVQPLTLRHFDTGERSVAMAQSVPPFVYAMSYLHDPHSDRMHAAVYHSAPALVRREQHRLPESPELYPPYPNPFNPSTTLTFRISERSEVELAVFDVTGRIAATLKKGMMDAGTYSQSWRAGGLSGGVYCVRLTVNGSVHTARVVLLK